MLSEESLWFRSFYQSLIILLFYGKSMGWKHFAIKIFQGLRGCFPFRVLRHRRSNKSPPRNRRGFFCNKVNILIKKDDYDTMEKTFCEKDVEDECNKEKPCRRPDQNFSFLLSGVCPFFLK